MEKIFEDANEQHVRNFVVYAKSADNKLYYEADHKTQVTKADAENAFKKGVLLVNDGTSLYAPIAMTGANVKTIDLVSTTVTVTSWATATA